MPAFVSNVEIEGVIYTEQVANTKKQAEISVAKVAYTKLKEDKESTDLTHRQHHANPKSPIGNNPNSVTADRASSAVKKLERIEEEELVEEPFQQKQMKNRF
ncbi:hypothetical protein K1719_013273 [Acacia pycnantha]|nr:hypothetical protein K1719_013273 [Acacia pycnantha]